MLTCRSFRACCRRSELKILFATSCGLGEFGGVRRDGGWLRPGSRSSLGGCGGFGGVVGLRGWLPMDTRVKRVEITRYLRVGQWAAVGLLRTHRAFPVVVAISVPPLHR
jgi:hypothetical protein